MPTGYTAILDDRPDVTLREFVLRCARGMGAMILQRDEDLSVPPRAPELTSYHLTTLKKHKAELAEVEGLSDEECDKRASDEYNDRRREREKGLVEERRIARAYERMRMMVRLWRPPTPDHKGLKDFMLEQLDRGQGGPYWEDLQIEKKTGKEWRKERTDRLLHQIQYAAEGAARDQQHHEETVEWLKQLYASLEEEK